MGEKRKGHPSWNKGKKGIYSEETINKMREARRLRKEKLGYLVSKEAREKISKKLKGKKFSEEAKKNMKGHSGVYIRTEENRKNIGKARKMLYDDKKLVHPMLGRRNPHSEEWKQKVSKKNKGSHLSEEVKLRMKTEKRGIYGRKNFKFSEESKKKMRIARVEYIKKICGYIHPNIGNNEKQILDKLEGETGYKILRQYKVEGYFLDGYIQELNLAIEVDERPKNKERDIEREKLIKNKLCCEFMRIKDYD